MALRIAEKASLTDVGRQRQSNEDSFLERPPLFAVADGMGGARAGEVASRMAVEAFDDSGADASPEEMLSRVAREANRRIYEAAQGDSEHAGMGTTLTAAVVSGREVAVGHVGDSRLYRLRDGRLERLTDDHSLVEELVRQGRLSPEEAENHPQRSIITRALGPEPEVDVETFTHPGRDGDVYLLCSDGLSGMVAEEDMAAIVRDSPSLDEAARELVDAANRNGGRDNITVLLFRLASEGDDDEESGDTPSEGTMALGPEEAGEARAEAAGDAGTIALGPEEAEQARAEAAAAAEAEPRRRAVSVRPPGSAPPTRGARPAMPIRRRRGVVGFLALIVAAALLVGIYVGSRQFYFLGTDGRGVVALYRGLPYDLPLGIHLYTTEYASSVPALSIEDRRVRSHLLDHKLRSRGDAVSRLRELERAETPR
ncbi:MAG TPA: Stp1/IreP family PP2C-type Ser/Thr phosphatase [Thermoleophilaceae bacterium]